MKKIIIISSMLFLLSVTTMNHAEYKNPITKELLHNIARVESNHNPKAVSHKGALGLYQIRFSVWKKELKKEGIIKNRNDLFIPEKNKKAAEFILTTYLKKTKGDMEKALYLYSGKDKSYSKKVLGE